jgi:hypothetical protein
MRRKPRKNAEARTVHADYLISLLTRDDSEKGKEAFHELCRLGCDPSYLGFRLVCIATDSPQAIVSTPDQRVEDFRRMGGRVTDDLIETERALGVMKREFHPRGMDSLEIALGGFAKRDVEALQNECRKLAERLYKLHSGRLMALSMDDPRPFELTRLLAWYAESFLPTLLEKIDHIGPKQKPDYTRLLTETYNHIKDKTNHWHDEHVAEILNHLLGHPPDRARSAESQRAWRRSHLLSDRKADAKSLLTDPNP